MIFITPSNMSLMVVGMALFKVAILSSLHEVSDGFMMRCAVQDCTTTAAVHKPPRVTDKPTSIYNLLPPVEIKRLWYINGPVMTGAKYHITLF